MELLVLECSLECGIDGCRSGSGRKMAEKLLN